MPIAKFEMPDGRIGRFEVPEGTSPEQAQSMISASIGGQPQERGWGDVAMSAIGNIPSSAAEFGKSIAHAVTSPVETVTTLGKLGKGAIQHALPESLVGSDEEAKRMASQVGQFYKNRYGSMEGFKEALATDPVGIAADVASVATGGGAALTKVPGMASVAAKVSAAGRAVDPLVAALRGTESVVGGAGKVANKILGLSTGVGEEPIRQAYRAGKVGGERQALFTENLRGEVPIQDVLDTAKTDLQAMREQQQSAYRSGMVDISKDASVLGFDDIDSALGKAAQRTEYKGQVISEGAAKKVQEARDIVNNWRNLDAAEFHTPEGMDNLKRKVGDILESIPFEQRNARSAIGDIYNSIKQTISSQAPSYSKVMKNYSEAADSMREIERSLSLGQKASADTSMRKLQSLMRNNVQTNYGNRLNLARELEQAGGKPILPALAGQALSEWTPRGLQRATAIPTAAAGYVAGGIPYAIGSAAASSPRLVGETALKAGQLARGIRSLQRGANIPFEAIGLPPNVLANALYQAGVNTRGQ